MYRNGTRNKDLAVSVRGRSRLVWLESRKYVDDGRGGVIKSSPCKLELHGELWLERKQDGSSDTQTQDLRQLEKPLLY